MKKDEQDYKVRLLTFLMSLYFIFKVIFKHFVLDQDFKS